MTRVRRGEIVVMTIEISITQVPKSSWLQSDVATVQDLPVSSQQGEEALDNLSFSHKELGEFEIAQVYTKMLWINEYIP